MAHRPVTIGGFSRRVRSSTGRSSSTWRLKKVLASVLVLGGLSFVTLSGTYAAFNSEAQNAGSSAASGTLTFSNTVNVGTACNSHTGPSSPGNVNTSCDALMTSSTLNYPGEPITPAKVTITNSGSLDASDLSLYMPSCAVGTTPGAPSPGGGNPCGAGGAQFYIQEANSSWSPTYCWFPVAGSGACTFVANSLYVFAANNNSVTSAKDLGGGPAHGQSRYFLIGLQFPSNASNALQGEEGIFALTWHITR